MTDKNSSPTEAARYSRRSILRSEGMYGHGFQAPGGRFLRFLRMELAHLERDRSSFLQEFTEADYQHLSERWIKEIQFREHGELRWGFFLARRLG